MRRLENKIDFMVVVSVDKANPNGDPLNGNQPRQNYDGHGEMSDVCIKRKIRNRMQDLGNEIFVQSSDRSDDGFDNLKDRAESLMKTLGKDNSVEEAVCKKWLDVRSFGQVFALKGKKTGDGVSIGIRGPVSVHQAVSVSPVDIESLQITKSVNGEKADKKSSDTMGMKHFVQFGVYVIKGAINVQLAEKTGFSDEDAEILKECLRTLFVNDASAARPDGSMEVKNVIWWKHNCKDGQYSSAKVHRSVKIALKNEDAIPTSFEDYQINIEALEGLEPEIINGL